MATTSAHAETGFRGYVAGEGRYFLHGAPFAGQERGNIPSLIAEPEAYYVSDSGEDTLTAKIFAHYDPNDAERSHADIRQLDWVRARGDWEMRLGVSKVYWGVTESRHLVDIINQVDGVEDVDEEDRLGQPMAQIATFRDWGSLRLFYMPYFRERTFAGRKGRLRGPLVVDTDHAEYDNNLGRHHPDIALRYSHIVGDWDVGLAHFHGTGREPTFRLSGGRLVPFYEIIDQSSLDLQYTTGAWLWKGEAIRRAGQGSAFFAATGGFEYTFYGLNENDHDLGVLAEYHYDGRDARAPQTPLEHDLFLGVRYTLNDIHDSELLAGVTTDVTDGSRFLVVEAARRLDDHWKLELDSRFFMNQDADATLYPLRDEDFLQARLSYYF